MRQPRVPLANLQRQLIRTGPKRILQLRDPRRICLGVLQRSQIIPEQALVHAVTGKRQLTQEDALAVLVHEKRVAGTHVLVPIPTVCVDKLHVASQLL
ncbi:hypothetical protein TcCL_ESM00285, partial [Trypanosoma cruzi]